MRVRFRPETRLPDRLDRNTKSAGHIFMVDSLAKAVRGFSEIHVYDPIDKPFAVYEDIYFELKGQPVNRTSLARRTQVISALVEDNSIRSTERMTEVHRDTIMRLLVQVGDGCERLLNERMRGLACQRLQVDEVWSFVAKKQRHLPAVDDPRRVGDVWTFVALDADTKLVPCYRIGKRNLPTASAFLTDLSERLVNRVQLSSDALAALCRSDRTGVRHRCGLRADRQSLRG